MLRGWIYVTLTLVLSAGAAFSQKMTEQPLPIAGIVAPNGTAIELSLAHAKKPRVGNVAVYRRKLGQVGAHTWQPIAPQLGPVLRFKDTDVKPGTAYEYQVVRSARDIVDVGYYTAGTKIPAVETRGTALVVVDESLAGDLALHLDRFERDLIGDGYEVVQHLTARGTRKNFEDNVKQATELREWIQEQYFSDPFGRHVLILVGHVPMALSGHVAPDGHRRMPHVTDLFYAEMDGTWRITRNEDGEALLAANVLPSSHIEMQVGRIDFSRLARENRDTELALLRSYFDKNHHWRQGLLGDIRSAYIDPAYLTVEQDGLRNIVGDDYIRTGGHHDVGEERPWLWGIDFGKSKASFYAEARNKAVFMINFGSHKQKIHRPGNTLTTTLARSWYAVAAGWGARPAWRIHHMALGGTIGESHLRTVNNGEARRHYRESMDYYPTGTYLWRNPIWVNLLGDPTMRAFMLSPPRNLEVSTEGETVRLQWEASPDSATQSYTVYRADSANGRFVPLMEGLTALNFVDAEPVEDGRYMVRAYGLKQVHAGSFYTYSQGAFGQTGLAALEAADRHIEAVPGKPVIVNIMPVNAETGVTEAFLRGPEHGTLLPTAEGWQLTLPDDASGEIALPYTRSSAAGTALGRYIVTVAN